MKKLLPPIVSGLLLVVLLLVTMLTDRQIGKDSLQDAAQHPDYVPITHNNDVTRVERSDAPIIHFTDAQGNTCSLDQFRGKTVVINFWASWCGPSYRELAMYQQAYEQYGDEVHFIMINTTSDNRETKEKADQMIADGGYTFPVYYDLDASAANAFSVISLPTSFFVDANGKAVAFAQGELSAYGFELGMQACQQSVEDAGGIQEGAPTDPTDPTDNTIPE